MLSFFALYFSVLCNHKAKETYGCFHSEEEALAFIREDNNGETPEEVEGDIDETNTRNW